jgi:molybdate transport system ATP-binding protein
MALDIDVSHRLGDFRLAARFTAEDGLIALIGPSGSGKTSLVNIIAGLIEPQEGRVAIDDTILVDRGRGIFVKPRHRRIGYVFQDGRLFPHLTVRQNLLYGRLFVPKRERFATVGEVVELLGLAALLGRRPALLSGGEKQRVAIGRALLTSPRLLLMDEPLASLDEQRRHEILPYIERLRDEVKIPIVYVSHSREEVERLASTIVRLAAGRVVSVTSAAGPRLISGDAAAERRQAE